MTTRLAQGVHSRDLLEAIEVLRESGENPNLLGELVGAALSVCTFVSAPLRCEGCGNSARNVMVYGVRVDGEGHPALRTVWCDDCREIVRHDSALGLLVSVIAPAPSLSGERGSGRLDFLIGCLIAALLAFAIVLGGTVAP